MFTEPVPTQAKKCKNIFTVQPTKTLSKDPQNGKKFVYCCFEPSQPLGITSGLNGNTGIDLSLIHI